MLLLWHTTSCFHFSNLVCCQCVSCFCCYQRVLSLMNECFYDYERVKDVRTGLGCRTISAPAESQLGEHIRGAEQPDLPADRWTNLWGLHDAKHGEEDGRKHGGHRDRNHLAHPERGHQQQDEGTLCLLQEQTQWTIEAWRSSTWATTSFYPFDIHCFLVPLILCHVFLCVKVQFSFPSCSSLMAEKLRRGKCAMTSGCEGMKEWMRRSWMNEWGDHHSIKVGHDRAVTSSHCYHIKQHQMSSFPTNSTLTGCFQSDPL